MAWCDVVEPRTLRECRIALGQSQAAFAALLGVSAESYRTWDAGRRATPPLVMVRARVIATHRDYHALLPLPVLALLIGVHVKTLRAAARDGRLPVTFDTRTTFRRLRTAAAHESPTDRLVRPMMADLRHALRQVPALAVGVIQDGAPELWNLLRPALLAEPLVTACYEAIRCHLTERLADVLRYGEPDASTRRARLSRWNESLDGTDHAIYRIRAWVRDRYADALARSDRRLLEQLAPHLTYLENNADLMHDACLRAVGLPVGSGVTEGACKSVIKLRTNGSSQRWRPTGLKAVLTLRSMHMSDRLPRFWANFARGYRKEVTLCA